MPPRPLQARCWLFTINNPESNDLPKNFVDVRYCIWQREKGEAGTEHLQGYVAFTKAKRLTQVKTLNDRAHWESRKGTEDQAVAYCSKEETRIAGPWELGERPQPGKRNDLIALKQTIEAGAPMKQIASEHFSSFMKYRNSIVSYKRLFSKPRDFKTFVGVITGPTGCGKSRLMEQTFPGAYWKPNGNEWFCDYDDHQVVIIDEFYGWLRYDFLLRLLDRYPLQCPTKGSSVNFRAKYVFFTSNSEIDSWYNFRGKMSLDALKRRIDFQACMDEHGTLTVLKGAFDFTRSYSGCGYIDSVRAGETLPVAQAQQEHAVRNTSPPRRTTLVLDESSSSDMMPDISPRRTTLVLDESSSSDMMPDIGYSQEDNTEEAKEAAISVLNRSNAFLYENYDAFAMSRTNFSDPEKSDSIEVEADHSPVLNYYMDFTSSDSDCEEQSPTEAQLRTDDIINYRPRLTAKAPPSKRRKLFD